MRIQFYRGGILLALLTLLLAPVALMAQESETDTTQKTKETAETALTEGPISTDPEGRAAVVNGVAIPVSQLETELKTMAQRMGPQGGKIPQEQLAMLRQQALNSIIDRELLYQETVKQKITADPEVIAQRHAQIKERFGEGEKYETAIKEMGLTDANIEEMISRSLVIEELVNTKVTSAVTVTAEEQKAFYDENPKFFEQPAQVQARHILIKLDEKADDQAKEDALTAIKEVQEKVAAGEDFAELAKTYSQGPSNTKGGDLGFFGKGQMVKPFEEAAFALQPGEVSDIVHTRFGYHIIKVTDRRDAATQPYEEASEKIGQYLKQQKSKEAFDTYLEGLKKEATIEKFI